MSCVKLGYEQSIALRIMRDTPGLEGSEICRKADCSFEELFALATKRLITIGNERIAPCTLHPLITKEGEQVLDTLLDRGGVE